MDDTSEDIEEKNPNKKRKILIIFDDMIAFMLSKKKLNRIATEIFMRGRKLRTGLLFSSRNLIFLCQKLLD